MKKKIQKSSPSQKTKVSPSEFIEQDTPINNDLSFLQHLKNPDNTQRELAFSLFADISNGMSKQEKELMFEDGCLSIILENLKENNTQILQNLLIVIQNLLFSEFAPGKTGKTKKKRGLKCQKLIENGLFNIFDGILTRISKGELTPEVLLQKIVNVIASFIEIYDNTPLETLIFPNIFMKICDFLDLIHDEEAFLEILSFINVITGVSPIVRESFMNNPTSAKKLLEIYNKPLENHQNVGLFLAKSLILSILDNLAQQSSKILKENFDSTLNFLEFSLNSPFFKDFSIFNDLLVAQNPANIESALRIYLKSSKAIELTLKFLNGRLSTENDDDDLSEECSSFGSSQEIEEETPTKLPNSVINHPNYEFIPLIITYKNQELLNLLSKFKLSREQMPLFPLYEFSNLEEINSGVCEAQFQALEALSLCFDQLEKLQNQNNSGLLKEKAGFLGLLWQRTMDFACSFKEIIECEAAVELLEQTFEVLIDLIERNQDLLAGEGVLEKQIPCDELFSLGKQVLALGNSSFLISFFEVLALRYPPRVSLAREINGEMEQIAWFVIEGANYGEPLVAGEALNTLFDIFENEAYDHILRKKGVLEKVGGDNVRKCLMKGKKRKKFLKNIINDLEIYLKEKRRMGV